MWCKVKQPEGSLLCGMFGGLLFITHYLFIEVCVLHLSSGMFTFGNTWLCLVSVGNVTESLFCIEGL